MKQIMMIKYVLQIVIVILLAEKHMKNINNHIMIQIFVYLNVKTNCIIDITIAHGITAHKIIINAVMIMNKKHAITEPHIKQ